MAGEIPDSFDIAAAGLRSDAGDTVAFVEALASRIEGALPDQCVVTRHRRGLLSRRAAVRQIAVQLGSRRFVLDSRRRELVAQVESQVHDMRRTTEQVPLGEWLELLQTELRQQAVSSAQARDALDRLLNS